MSFRVLMSLIGSNYSNLGIDRYYYKETWTHPYLAFPNYSTIKTSDYNEFQGGFFFFIH